MRGGSDEFFFFIGANLYGGDSSSDKLRAAGVPIRRKSFYSSPENWAKIGAVITDPDLIGAVVKLTSYTFKAIVMPNYIAHAQQIFRALSAVPHMVFVYESLLSADDDIAMVCGQDLADDPLDPYSPPDSETRRIVRSLLLENNVNVMPYTTNAEMSVLAMTFIDDNERNLLFRVYVPSGRLYAAEAEKLLSLFRDWLQLVGKRGVRQDGYKTAAGQVYEFFGGDDSLRREHMADEFEVFSQFLANCIEDPRAASLALSSIGVNIRDSEAVVARYGKEARRLQLDVRQERESRLLTIRHSLESELLEIGAESLPAWAEIGGIVDSIVPGWGDLMPAQLVSLPASTQSCGVTLNVSQQFINAVDSTVVQNVQGTTNLAPQGKELLELIDRYGGDNKAALKSALHEFEDPDARPANRVTARQKLKSFLIRISGDLEGVAFRVLEKYLETKIGGK